MYEYIEPYPTYDKILELFMTNQAHRLDEGYIYSKFDQEKQVGIRSALASLEEKKCIRKDSPTGNWFILLDEGSSIYNSGSFRGYLERQKISYEIKEQLDAATLKMADSVVKTNDSVETTNNSVRNLNDIILPANFTAQEKFSNRSLWLAFFSVVFIGVTAYLQYQDKTAQRVEELKREVKETSKTLKELQSSLKEVNSSIQKIKTDTVFVKQK
ncbi:MAG: hypothetical protein ACSLE0_11820 [Chitinophagaceae bacterium]